KARAKENARRAGQRSKALPAASQHDDFGARRRALEEIDHVVVVEADAARGNVEADGPRLARPVDAITRVASIVVEIQGPGAERIVGAAGHEGGKDAPARPLAGDHLRRRRPAGPHLLVADVHHAAPAEAGAADADAVANGLVVA